MNKELVVIIHSIRNWSISKTVLSCNRNNLFSNLSACHMVFEKESCFNCPLFTHESDDIYISKILSLIPLN